MQVATHCASAVLDNNERTSKLGQKLVRAGVLQPLCALLALSVPIEVSIPACDADTSSAAPADSAGAQDEVHLKPTPFIGPLQNVRSSPATLKPPSSTRARWLEGYSSPLYQSLWCT